MSFVEQRRTSFRKRRKRARPPSAVAKRKAVETRLYDVDDNDENDFFGGSAASALQDHSSKKKHGIDIDICNRSTLENRSSRSLPILLAQRQSGTFQGSPEHWRSKMLKERDSEGAHTKSAEERTRWRPYAARCIPFSQLETPLSDAVLSLNRNGSYLVSLGSSCRTGMIFQGEPYVCPILALRFYSVPSPHTLHRKKRLVSSKSFKEQAQVVISPLIQTVPLLVHGSNNEHSSSSSLLGENSTSSVVASTPVQLLISSDSVLGVAFLHNPAASSSSGDPSVPVSSFTSSPATQDEDALATLVLFALPGIGSRVNRNTKEAVKQKDVNTIACTYKCSNVRVGARKAFTMRNLLWKTDCLPQYLDLSTRSERFCDSVWNVPGYILFNDEDDGYRITWIVPGSWCDDKVLSPLKDSSFKIEPSRCDIMTHPEDNVWDECWHERHSGSVYDTEGEPQQRDLDIVFEGYLRVDALLTSLLEGKKYFQNAKAAYTDFYYNLVSVTGGGRIGVLAIVFANGIKGPASFGVLLRFDLFTQAHEEIEWVQHPSRSDSAFLRQWCNTLALNHRMREKRVGPFCIGVDANNRQKHQNWGFVPEDDANFDPNEAADVNEDIWKAFVQSVNATGSKNAEPQKDFSFCSLYLDCDLVTNRAVTSVTPVHFLNCRNAPTKLSYG